VQAETSNSTSQRGGSHLGLADRARARVRRVKSTTDPRPPLQGLIVCRSRQTPWTIRYCIRHRHIGIASLAPTARCFAIRNRRSKERAQHRAIRLSRPPTAPLRLVGYSRLNTPCTRCNTTACTSHPCGPECWPRSTIHISLLHRHHRLSPRKPVPDEPGAPPVHHISHRHSPLLSRRVQDCPPRPATITICGALS
jgi:hypothetical protein